MKSRRSFSFLIRGISVGGGLLLVWPWAAMTWQEQSSPRSQATPTIDEYQPKSTLITGEHKIERAQFPFIDIHSHHWNPTADGKEDYHQVFGTQETGSKWEITVQTIVRPSAKTQGSI